jgi:hypothetical protein
MQLQLPTKITRSSVQTFINRLRNNPDYRRTNYLSKPCQRPLPASEELRTRVPAGAYINEDGEVSSRDLTRWYVAEFSNLNNLKGA